MARMQGKTSSEEYEYFAGVDVSKAHLDLRLHGTGHGTRRGQRFANTDDGIAALLAVLARPHLVVFEPTGRYHIALWRALEGAGHGTAPVNPYQARHLATGLGHHAKTDRIDAMVLCTIAARLRPAVKPAPSDFALEIMELFAAQRAAIKHRAMVRTQAKASFNAQVRGHLAAVDAFLTAEIKALTASLKALFMANPRSRRVREIVMSIPGFAEGAAATILSRLPEIGTLTRGEIAALTGTAPMTRESGQWRGRAGTRGGRRDIRSALHMPAVVAMNKNPDLQTFAAGLKARGKHSSTIITAVLRKLLVLANTLVAQNRLWTPNSP
ncbi:MAG: IS110 family transposase [Paracoccaceae bacterium]